MDDYGKVLEYVLKGDAVLLVGSGASAEMGYPSWSDQIEFLEKKVAEQGKELPNEFYEYKNKCQLPQAMESIERLIGRSGLLNLLRVSLVPARPSEDSIYNVVTKWPFQLYLTTNFDDEIIKHLKKNKRTEFAVLGNSESDFSVLLPDATGYVFKIHGELTENGGAVVTDKDYDGFKVGADKRYYRKALQALFRSRRIIVIGYSFSDSDLRYLLDRATEDASLAYALYRVIQSLPNENAPTMTMYDCLHRELIGTGFRLVDESNYNRFFSDAINVAKMDFQNEFEEYVEEVESGSALEKEEFEAYFNTIPDIEKPIFVAAMKERLAKRDKERVLDEIQKRQTAEKRASGLEQQIAALKEELSKAKAMSEKERRRKDVEERTLRNAGDAKHVAKRLRQAKKRLRKGKKRR